MIECRSHTICAKCPARAQENRFGSKPKIRFYQFDSDVKCIMACNKSYLDKLLELRILHEKLEESQIYLKYGRLPGTETRDVTMQRACDGTMRLTAVTSTWV